MNSFITSAEDSVKLAGVNEVNNSLSKTMFLCNKCWVLSRICFSSLAYRHPPHAVTLFQELLVLGTCDEGVDLR